MQLFTMRAFAVLYPKVSALNNGTTKSTTRVNVAAMNLMHAVYKMIIYELHRQVFLNTSQVLPFYLISLFLTNCISESVRLFRLGLTFSISATIL